jgi:hypothetical protein
MSKLIAWLKGLFGLDLIDHAAKSAGEPIPAPFQAPKQDITKRVYGFTLEWPPSGPQAASFKQLPQAPWVRLVFQDGDGAHSYIDACKLLKSVGAIILGELLDSEGMKHTSLEKYQARAQEYLHMLGDLVDVWEIGNEVNGDWLGSHVADKIIAAHDVFHGVGLKTAVTLYMDEEETWAPFAHALPANFRASLDYALMSHYPGDNNGYAPNWNNVAHEMGDLFPNARLGLGEMGPSEEHEFHKMTQAQRLKMAKHYWRLPVDHARWIGFGGFWYGSQEIAKDATAFRAALIEVMS